MGARKVTGPPRWIPLIAVLAGAVVFIAPQVPRVVRNFPEDGLGASTAIFVGLGFPVVLVAAIVAWFAFHSRARRAAITRDYPGARQVQFVPTRELAAAAKILNARISTTAYGTMVVSDGRLKLFVGSGETPRVELPAGAIRDISVGESLAGARWMLSIDITVSGPNGTVRLPIVPIRDRGNVLRTFSEAEVETMAEQLRHEVDPLHLAPAP